MSKKDLRAVKKVIRREILKCVRDAFKYDNYCYLFEEYDNEWFLTGLYSRQMNSVVKNRHISNRVNAISTSCQDYHLCVHNDYLFPSEFPVDINQNEPRLNVLGRDLMVLYHAMPRQKDGKVYYEGLSFDRILNNVASSDFIGVQNKDGCDIYQVWESFSERDRFLKLWRQPVLDSLVRLLNRYDFFVLNKWTRCFWYKKWLRQVCRDQGIMFLPTVDIK